MNESKYNLEANARFAKALQEWVDAAPEKAAPPRVGRDREAFLCDSLLGPESRHLTLLWEKIGDIFVGEMRQVIKEGFYLYFDNQRTPVVIVDDLMLLDIAPARVIGKIHRDRELGHSLLDPQGRPLSSRALAMAALDEIGRELSPLLVASDEFLRTREAASSRIREFSIGDREGMICSVHYDKETRELYVRNRASGAEEVLLAGLDEERAKELAGNCHSVEALREVIAETERPLLSDQDALVTLRVAGRDSGIER